MDRFCSFSAHIALVVCLVVSMAHAAEPEPGARLPDRISAPTSSAPTGDVKAGTPAAGPSSPPHSTAGLIVDLIAKSDDQIAHGHAYWPYNDSAIGNLGLVLRLLPYATPEERLAFKEIPTRFEARARAEKAAGSDQLATVYRQFAAAVLDYPLDSRSAADTAGAARPSGDHGEDAGAPPAAGSASAASPSTGSTPPRSALATEAELRSEPKGERRMADADTRRSDMPPMAALHSPGSMSAHPARIRVASPGYAAAPAIGQRCQAIILKMQLGENVPDAERAYLRHGCNEG